MRTRSAGGVTLALSLLAGCSRHDHSRIFLRDLESQLSELVSQQEEYFSTHHTYSTSLGAITDIGDAIFISVADTAGFSATATHPAVDGVVCAVYIGAERPRFDGMSQAVPFCEQVWRGRFEIAELPYDHDVAHAAMKQRLQAIVFNQQAFYRDSGYYAARLLDSPKAADTSVTVQLVSATRTGFSATARHSASPATCAVFIGTAAAPITPLEIGHAGCTEPD